MLRSPQGLLWCHGFTFSHHFGQTTAPVFLTTLANTTLLRRPAKNSSSVAGKGSPSLRPKLLPPKKKAKLSRKEKAAARGNAPPGFVMEAPKPDTTVPHHVLGMPGARSLTHPHHLVLHATSLRKQMARCCLVGLTRPSSDLKGFSCCLTRPFCDVFCPGDAYPRPLVYGYAAQKGYIYSGTRHSRIKIPKRHIEDKLVVRQVRFLCIVRVRWLAWIVISLCWMRVTFENRPSTPSVRHFLRILRMRWLA